MLRLYFYVNFQLFCRYICQYLRVSKCWLKKHDNDDDDDDSCGSRTTNFRSTSTTRCCTGHRRRRATTLWTTTVWAGSCTTRWCVDDSPSAACWRETATSAARCGNRIATVTTFTAAARPRCTTARYVSLLSAVAVRRHLRYARRR